MNKEHIVILRVQVDDNTLRVLGRRNGLKGKATLRDFRAWADSTLNAEIEEIVSTPEWQED